MRLGPYTTRVGRGETGMRPRRDAVVTGARRARVDTAHGSRGRAGTGRRGRVDACWDAARAPPRGYPPPPNVSVDPEVLALLCAAAFLAGGVDAVVGGGGLVQLPALFVLLPDARAVALLGTNKLSSVFGTATAAVTYSRLAVVDWRTALPAAAAAFVLSAAGARTADLVDEEALRLLVLVLCVAVAVWTLLRPRVGESERLRWGRAAQTALAAALGAALGFYDGVFGPGTGSFLVIGLVGLLGFSFLHASATAKVVNTATNLAALAYFGLTGAVLWGYLSLIHI